MDFRFIHVHSYASIDSGTVAREIAKIFPCLKVDIRSAFEYDGRIERARITDLKHPFERQPKQVSGMKPLYDGFVLQRMFAEMIPAAEADHVHIIFTGLLMCTFSEHDWRYHARAVVCGTPSIVSTAGIVEAPAKPKEFYLAQLGGAAEVSLKKRCAGRFIDYSDARMTAAAILYALQALFFFVLDGEPFCEDKDCKLYNAHWQEELIHVIKRGTFCARHERAVNKFNNRK
ncbi:MAG TPA: DUF6775 family putative metallopeptidase [Nitrososphaera sp.]